MLYVLQGQNFTPLLINTLKQEGGIIMVWECFSPSVVGLLHHIRHRPIYVQRYIKINLLSHIEEMVPCHIFRNWPSIFL